MYREKRSTSSFQASASPVRQRATSSASLSMRRRIAGVAVRAHHSDEEELPAWSLPADASASIRIDAGWPERITPDWAWGGSTGAGVRVCVLDSGIEHDHPLVGAVQRSVAARKDGETIVIEEDDEGDLCGHGTAC